MESCGWWDYLRVDCIKLCTYLRIASLREFNKLQCVQWPAAALCTRIWCAEWAVYREERHATEHTEKTATLQIHIRDLWRVHSI